MGYSDQKFVELKLRDDLSDAFIIGVKALCRALGPCKIVGMTTNSSVSIRHRFRYHRHPEIELDLVLTFEIFVKKFVKKDEQNQYLEIWLMDARDKNKIVGMISATSRTIWLDVAQTAQAIKKRKPLLEYGSAYGTLERKMKGILDAIATQYMRT